MFIIINKNFLRLLRIDFSAAGALPTGHDRQSKTQPFDILDRDDDDEDYNDKQLGIRSRQTEPEVVGTNNRGTLQLPELPLLVLVGASSF